MLEPKFNGPEHRENTANSISKIIFALPGYSEDYLKGICLIINGAYNLTFKPYMKLAGWEYKAMVKTGWVPILKDNYGNVAYIFWPETCEKPRIIIEKG